MSTGLIAPPAPNGAAAGGMPTPVPAGDAAIGVAANGTANPSNPCHSWGCVDIDSARQYPA